MQKQNTPRYVRYLGITLVLLLSAESFQAQALQWGGSAGINVSQISGDGLNGFNKIGLLIGPQVRYPMKGRFSMSAELLFSQKGSRNKPNASTGNYYSSAIKLNYIDLPITCNWRVNDFLFDTGLSLDFLLQQKTENDGVIRDPDVPFNKVELGAVLGFRYLIKEEFYLGFRFFHSVLPTRQNPNEVAEWRFYGWGQFNQVLQFSAGFFIP